MEFYGRLGFRYMPASNDVGDVFCIDIPDKIKAGTRPLPGDADCPWPASFAHGAPAPARGACLRGGFRARRAGAGRAARLGLPLPAAPARKL